MRRRLPLPGLGALLWLSLLLVNPLGAAAQQVGWQWGLRLGSTSPSSMTSFDQAYGLATDRHGNLYVTGSFGAQASFTGSSQLLPGFGQADFLLASYDSTGAFRWARTAGSPTLDWGSAVTTDRLGRVYVVGQRQGNMVLGGNVGTLRGLGGFVARYDAQGNAEWAQALSMRLAAQASAVTADAFGNVVVGGTLLDSLTLGPFHLPRPTSSGDFFVVSYNPAGQVNWARSFTTARFGVQEGTPALAADSLGNVFFTGTFLQGSLRVSPTIQLTTQAAQALFLVKFDDQGVVQWARQAELAAGAAVAADAAGNVYVSGDAKPGARFGTTALAVGGSGDAVLARYDARGQLRWVRHGGGPRVPDLGRGVSVDARGGVYQLAEVGSYPAQFGPLRTTWAYDALRTVVVKYGSTGTEQWLAATDADAARPRGLALTSRNRPAIAATMFSQIVALNNRIIIPPVGYGDLLLARVDPQLRILSMRHAPAVARQLGPNPVPAGHPLRRPDGREALDYRISDLRGRLLLRGRLRPGETELALPAWPAGVYMLQATTASGQWLQRLVVE